MKIPLKAWYFRGIVELKKLRERVEKQHRCHGDSDSLLIEFSEQQKVCVSSFGAVVFWPFDEAVGRWVSQEIEQVVTDPGRVEEVEDRLVVHTEKGETQALFNEIWLAGVPTDPQVHLISQLLGQSVALEHLELEVTAALDQFEGVFKDMRCHGRVRLSTRQILKRIGFSMETRNEVLNNIALFDKPEVTWEVEDLEKLHRRLVDFFELKERQETLWRKLDFLGDHTTKLFTFLSTRKSLYVEWIIVVLIALEALFFVVQALRP